MKLTIEQLKAMGYKETIDGWSRDYVPPQSTTRAPTSHPDVQKVSEQPKPLLNGLESKWKAVLTGRGLIGIMEQAITLRLDPPFRSYTPDLAYVSPYSDRRLVLVEVKGPHRFREKGIAKASLAAKTYTQFLFILADWNGKEWREMTL